LLKMISSKHIKNVFVDYKSVLFIIVEKLI